AHSGRDKLRMIKRANRESLVGAKSMGQFWRQIDRLSGPKAGSSEVSAYDLQGVFCGRLNPAPVMPVLFDAVQHRINRVLVASIPEITTDGTPEQLFTLPWLEDDVDEIKSHLEESSLKKA
ncbi:hypothetical protein C8J56DRAFT_714730, partial [Mycena floridula]